MDLTEGRLGEHRIRHESLLLFLSPPQSGVMFRAKGEGHSWALLSLLFLHHKDFLYVEDVKVQLVPPLPPLCTQHCV